MTAHCEKKDYRAESLIYHLDMTLTSTILDRREKTQVDENASG